VLEYYITFRPETNITIDPETGLIEWSANIDNLSAPDYELEITVYVTDGHELISSSFNISVILNPHPTTQLIAPTNNSIVSLIGAELKWIGFDDLDDPLTFDLYLSSSKTSIIKLAESARILNNTKATSYFVEGLNMGRTYYWTVIPQDGFRYGVCLDGLYNFEINSPPEISSISSQKATVGKELIIEIKASDTSADQMQNLQFGLENAPEDMTIEPTTGLLSWTPTKEQVGEHGIKVWVSDGIDKTNITFEIEVVEKPLEKESPGIFSFSIIIIIIIIVFIVILLLIFFIVCSKRKKGKKIEKSIPPENQESIAEPTQESEQSEIPALYSDFHTPEPQIQDDLYYIPPEETTADTTYPGYTTPKQQEGQQGFEELEE
jgi:hypothetical protein